MIVTNAEKIWEFDVDDTLVLWDLSKYPEVPKIEVLSEKTDRYVLLVPHTKNIKLLQKLSMVGWYIRVHSGSGSEWARKVVEKLNLTRYVDEVCAKPLGRTDDRPAGDGLAYQAYRNPTTGAE